MKLNMDPMINICSQECGMQAMNRVMLIIILALLIMFQEILKPAPTQENLQWAII